jgi:hypothetical protein
MDRGKPVPHVQLSIGRSAWRGQESRPVRDVPTRKWGMT